MSNPALQDYLDYIMGVDLSRFVQDVRRALPVMIQYVGEILDRGGLTIAVTA